MNEDRENYTKFTNNLIKKFVKDLQNNNKYKIIDSLSGKEPTEKELLEIFYNKSKRCVGIIHNSNNISQCSKNAIENIDYCKNHYKKYIMTNLINVDNKVVNDTFVLDKEDCKDLKNLQKKFIEDSFYYIDSEFIYNTDGEKSGIIKNNKYILTEDPYILEQNK